MCYLMSKLIQMKIFDRNDSVKYLFFTLIQTNYSSSSYSSSSSSSSLSTSFLITRILFLLWFSPLVQLNPNCKCVKFTASYTPTNHGIFTSPDWPKPYDPGIDCLLYIFIGKPGQLIEISFNTFDVYASSTTDCLKGDFVRLLLNPSNESITLTELESSGNVICGNSISEWKRKQYSFDSLLILEFHTTLYTSNGQHHGFSGTYRFIESSLYKTDGQPLAGSTCDYQFLSISTNSNETVPLVGKFFSPNYPNRYPSSSHCAYHFMGKYNERVKVVFEKIVFGNKDSSCLGTNDVVLIHDGPDIEAPLIGRLCNDDKFVEIISSGPDLLIIFHSHSKLSPSAKGFQALYSFNQSQLSVNSISSLPSHHNNLNQKQKHHHHQQQREQRIQQSNQDSDEMKLSRDETLDSKKSFTCDQFINSEMSLNGSFHSPNYPDIYPEGVRCRYYFNGHGKQRVQIVFNEFDLVKSSLKPKPMSCESSDTLMVLLTINGNKESLDTFCGSKKPYNLMSNGPNLLVEFRSGHYLKRQKVKGFKANYRFVTNFGINSGQQEDNQVYLNFIHFDIEGVPPCNADSASDYIEFSNYPWTDHNSSRHCGFKKPKSVISANNFFRLIFKSNNQYDGTGFQALYSFIDARKINVGAKPLSSNWNEIKPGSWTTVIIFIFLVLPSHMCF
uniref:CUB domain-containing protein n=1 Tax=Tetranychus urticae TaxID=32264 RepID=T1JTV6_TETUR